MPVVLDTVVEYENKFVELLEKAQQPVNDAIRKAVEFADERLPEVEYPATLATPLEVLDTQITFARKLLETNAELAKSVLVTIAPVAGYPVPAKARAKATRTPAAA
jgi:hypothetical protein